MFDSSLARALLSILASTLIAAAACDGASDTKATDTKATDTKATDTKATDAKTSDAKTPDAKATDAKTSDAKPTTTAAGGYVAPATPCGIADLSLLGSDVGTPNEGSIETEGIDTKVTGCTYDLVGETVNTFKLLVYVGADAEARYALSEEVWSQGTIPGFVAEPVSGLGSKAIYAVRLTADNQRIESTLALLDRDLSLEVRFMGGGTKAWDGADMRDRLTKIARAAMTKLAKP